MDYLSNLPVAVLSIIHHLVHKSGGLRSVLHFEAASKKLSIMFRKCSRLQQAMCVKRPALLPFYITRSTAAGPSFSFSRWLAAHGHRLDDLTLNELHLELGQPALCGQPGLTQVRELTITTSAPQTLVPLKGLVNLVRLKCQDVGCPADQYGAGVCVSLKPLGLLTALKSLELVDENCSVDTCGNHKIIDVCTAISSLAPLSSLTNLTELRLFGLDGPPISLAGLSSLSPTLSSLTCLVGDVSMDHVSSFTNLTSLSWAADEIVNLEPIGKLLKLRSLHVKAVFSQVYVDLQPLSSLEVLQVLRFDGRIHPTSIQPISGLGSTLQELIMSDADMVQTIQVTFSELSALTCLTRLGVKCGSSLDFLSPLTLLKHVKVRCDGCASLEPIQKLTALTQLALETAFMVTSLAPLSLLGCLQQLHLFDFDHLSSLQPLSTLTALSSMELWLCESVSSLAPLSTLTALTSLELKRCRSVSSLEPLAALVGLQQLTLHHCSSIDHSMCSSLLSALPGLTLIGLPWSEMS